MFVCVSVCVCVCKIIYNILGGGWLTDWRTGWQAGYIYPSGNEHSQLWIVDKRFELQKLVIRTRVFLYDDIYEHFVFITKIKETIY